MEASSKADPHARRAWNGYVVVLAWVCLGFGQFMVRCFENAAAERRAVDKMIAVACGQATSSI
jgi:hypothetical protein